LVVPTVKSRTHKVRQAAKYPKIKVVAYQWLADSISKWERQDETQYLVSTTTNIHMRQVELHEQDRQHNGPSSVPSSIHDSDESDDETETVSGDDESESVPASQEEEQDDEGVMPDDFEGGHSPIDDLKTFDWGGADEELAEFMGSDSDNDSDTGSVSSRHSQASNLSLRGVKRNHNEIADEEDSDEGSELAKRQRISSSRTTGLKTVKTPLTASESSLPTPGPTGGEDEGGYGEDGGDYPEDDLEADLMAAFEMDEPDAADMDTAG
jgi:RNA polymerase II subunit A-like phosphatase